MSDSVLVETRENFLEITLNRPDRLNSFNEEMHAQLQSALSKAATSETCRAVLLTGKGRGFCAGQDLGDRDPAKMDGPPDLGHTLNTFFNPLVRKIRSLPKPVICAVNGVAAGAGANLAFACDMVLAARNARFIQSFSKVGLIPDAGGSWMLAHLIGEMRAKSLAMTAMPLSAQKAEDWGLVWKVFDDDELLSMAREQVADLAAGPTFGLGLTKHAIQSACHNTLDQHLDLEAELQRKAGRSPDYAEGVSAFLEKRAAKFSGREQ